MPSKKEQKKGTELEEIMLKNVTILQLIFIVIHYYSIVVLKNCTNVRIDGWNKKKKDIVTW